jgi:hypothetical protein
MIKYPPPKEDRVLKPMESGYYTFAKGFSSDNAAMIGSTITQIAEASASIDSKALEDGLHGFLEGVQVLMKGLDEVAKLHPFVGGTLNCHLCPKCIKLIFCIVAVLAFKAVVTLELKRRANDKKVIALNAEMGDMMSVLLE